MASLWEELTVGMMELLTVALRVLLRVHKKGWKLVDQSENLMAVLLVAMMVS
jgi:hypothetical protein